MKSFSLSHSVTVKLFRCEFSSMWCLSLSGLPTPRQLDFLSTSSGTDPNATCFAKTVDLLSKVILHHDARYSCWPSGNSGPLGSVFAIVDPGSGNYVRHLGCDSTYELDRKQRNNV